MQKMSLEEYARLHPDQEGQPDQSIKETARSYEEWQRDQETVARIKEGITHQLEQGNAPQYILYGAIQAIGILTRDKEWAEAGQQALNAVYEDLAQESLLVNNAAVAAHRLEEMKTAYNEKLRRQLERNIKGYGKIEKALNEALRAVEALDPQEEQKELFD